jgi:hypothetical protein
MEDLVLEGDIAECNTALKGDFGDDDRDDAQHGFAFDGCIALGGEHFSVAIEVHVFEEDTLHGVE